jgi:hypothetical protein
MSGMHGELGGLRSTCLFIPDCPNLPMGTVPEDNSFAHATNLRNRGVHEAPRSALRRELFGPESRGETLNES